MSNYVFLIDAQKTPMNPIHPAPARKLLEQGKAAVFRRYPFTLILKRTIENPIIHPLTIRKRSYILRLVDATISKVLCWATKFVSIC